VGIQARIVSYNPRIIIITIVVTIIFAVLNSLVIFGKRHGQHVLNSNPATRATGEQQAGRGRAPPQPLPQVQAHKNLGEKREREVRKER
jgi:hypothetical protein